MKATHWFYQAGNCIKLILAANEEQVAAANEGVVAGSFSIEQKDGFTINYGEYAHSAGLQIFDKASATAMANDLSSVMGKITRGFRGVPVYAGHPDHHDLKIRTQFPDRRARGWVKEIIANEDHAKFVVAWNELGRGEVDDAQWAGYSPYWLMQQLPGLKARPVKLVSFALTNQPNIPVTPLAVANEDDAALANESTTTAATMTMNIDLNKLTAALIEAGLIKEGDDEAAILSSIGSLAGQLQWARDAKAREEREMMMMKEKMSDAANTREELFNTLLSRAEATAANTAEFEALTARLATQGIDLAAANERVTALQTAHSAERAARVDAELKRLVTAANITAAESDAQRPLLLAAANEDEFNAILTPLSQKKITLQTTPQIAHELAGQRGVLAANEVERSNHRRELVKKHLDAITKGAAPTQDQYDAAWHKARTEKPELF